ncbi:Cytochrome P450 CYP3213D1, partial [Hyalella azteca]
MVSEWLLFVLAAFFVYWLWSGSKPRYHNLPPGPKGWPLIGTLPKSGQSFDEFFSELQRQYGDIFMLRAGSVEMLGLTSYALMKEAYALPTLQGRSQSYTTQMFTMFTNAGLVFSTGKTWVNGRRFALKHLKDLGMGRSSMQTIIQEEAEVLIQDFAKSLGKPMQVAYNVNVAILNVIWRLVADERFDVTNEEMQALTRRIEDNLTLILGPMSLLDWFPWLNYLPGFVKDTFFETKLGRENMEALTTYLKKVIAKHQATLDKDNIRDYIDRYLVEMENQKNDPDSTFRADLIDLTISILDLFAAGSETTSSTIRWFILYMAVYPEVQRKVQEHIDQVVPEDRLPTLQDELPYLEAVIAEVNRCISLAPIIVPHVATETTQLAGYTIPKGTMIMGSIKASHMDPNLFEEPEVFRPERFLDSEGKFFSREGYMPFGIGRRQCLGESLARMELFVVASSVLKTFTISAPEGVTLNTKHEEPNRKLAVLNFAKPYEVVMNKR